MDSKHTFLLSNTPLLTTLVMLQEDRESLKLASMRKFLWQGYTFHEDFHRIYLDIVDR